MVNFKSGKVATLALTAALTVLINGQMATAAEASGSIDADTQISTPAQPGAESKHPEVAHVKRHTAHYKKVVCSNPHAACEESEKVIETLKLLSHLYSEGKFDEMSNYIDDGITTFDEKKNKLIVGKEAVVSEIKTRWNAAHSSGSPIVNYTINHPYAKVTGDQAVVTFEAVKTIGGKNPETMVSRCTDIFVKKDGTWKKLHYRSCWKKGKGCARS